MNRAGQLAERLLRLDLVVLDELGYMPFSPSGAVPSCGSSPGSIAASGDTGLNR